MKAARRAIALTVLGSAAVLAVWALSAAVGHSDAALAGALATIALCLITGWYAWLNNQLVVHNQEQLAELRRSAIDLRRSRAIVFANLADRVGAAVNELPGKLSNPGFDAGIRAGVLWRPEELRELEQLAAHLGPWVAAPLVQVVNYLNWISARVAEVRAVPVLTGYDYTKFPKEKWEWAWAETMRQLPITAKLARDEAERLSTSETAT